MRAALWGVLYGNPTAEALARALRACGVDVWQVILPLAEPGFTALRDFPTLQADDIFEYSFDLHFAFDEGTLEKAQSYIGRGRPFLCRPAGDRVPFSFEFQGQSTIYAPVPVIDSVFLKYRKLIQPRPLLGITASVTSNIAYSCVERSILFLDKAGIQVLVNLGESQKTNLSNVTVVLSPGSEVYAGGFYWCLRPSSLYGFDVLEAFSNGCIPVVFDSAVPAICRDGENSLVLSTPINPGELVMKLQEYSKDISSMLNHIEAALSNQSLSDFREVLECLLDTPEVEWDSEPQEVPTSSLEVIAGHAAAALAAAPAVRKFRLVEPDTRVILKITDGASVPFIRSFSIYDRVELIDDLGFSKLDRSLNVGSHRRVFLDFGQAVSYAVKSGKPVAGYIASNFPISVLYDAELRFSERVPVGDEITVVGPSVSHLGAPFFGDSVSIAERIRTKSKLVVTDDIAVAVISIACGIPVILISSAPASILSNKKSKVRCVSTPEMAAHILKEVMG